MRVTREILIRTARETAQKVALSEPGLVAAYLTGSLRTDDPYLDHTTDVDIVLVHAGKPKVRREIVALTPDVHLDLVHNPRSDYERPKELRVHPWFGPELYDPLPLVVTAHFFEFIQAGVREKYMEPVNVLARVRTLAGEARQTWKDLQAEASCSPECVLAYLKSIRLAVNAIALLTGGPLPERRFLLQFPERAAAAGEPGLAAGLLGLLGANQVDPDQLNGLLPDWERAFTDATGRPHAHASLAAPRLAYYRGGMNALLAGEFPSAAIWPLLITWTRAAAVLPMTRVAKWKSACELFGISEASLPEKRAGLDAFLDRIEEILDNFASGQGL